MKKIIFGLVVLFHFTSFSQNSETLKSDVKKMYDASYNLAFEEVLNYTHPKVFEMASKEDVLAAMENAFDNETMRIRLVHINPTFTYSDIKTIEGKSLCLINYTNAMRMTFENKLSGDEVETMKKSFTESGEYKTVNFEKDRNSFFLEGNSILIAVSDESTQGKWKFVNYSKTQAQLAEMLLGATILKGLGL
jgi:hypothetical protein